MYSKIYLIPNLRLKWTNFKIFRAIHSISFYTMWHGNLVTIETKEKIECPNCDNFIGK